MSGGQISSMDLTASGHLMSMTSKKVPLLPSPPKAKNEPETYVFELELGESNDLTYPEFSWAELVRDAKAKEKTEKKKNETPVVGSTLNPYASDDDDDLKAMAAKFEEKYGNGKPAGKKKKRREDYIDRGAGYDDTDPFIDNTDAYDELVPHDLQPVYGGFYINSGQLDFKEVQISADEDDGEDTRDKIFKTKPSTGKKPGTNNDIKTPVQGIRETGEPLKKKRKVSTDTPVSRPIEIKERPVGSVLDEKDGSWQIKPQLDKNNLQTGKSVLPIPKVGDGTKKRPLVIRSSSSSSSSSSSDSSSSTDSDDSSSSANENPADDRNPNNIAQGTNKKKNIPHKKHDSTTKLTAPKGFRKIESQGVTSQSTTMPQRKLKMKNVPLNPNLHRNSEPLPSTIIKTPVTSNATININPKLTNRKKSIGNSSRSRPRSPLIVGGKNSAATVIRVPTPKSVPTPTSSPVGIFSLSQIPTSISPDTLIPKPKLKPKPKPVILNSPEAMAQELLNTISRANLGMPHPQKSSPKFTSGIKPPRSAKPLPKLQHRSGFTIEKQGEIQNVSSSSFGKTKTLKTNPKHAINHVTAVSNAQAALQAYATMSGYFQTSSSGTGPGPGVEITKRKSPHFPGTSPSISPSSNQKHIPALGSGITVTEVKEQLTNAGINVQTASTSSSIPGYGNSNIFPAHSQPSTSTNPANFSSTLTNSMTTSSQSNGGSPRIPQSITITPTALTMNLSTSGDKERSDRFSLNSLGLGSSMGHKNKLPGYITPFDVNSLLSGNPKLSLDNDTRQKPTMEKLKNQRDIERK